MTTFLVFLGLACVLTLSVMLASEVNELRHARSRLRARWRRKRTCAAPKLEAAPREVMARPPVTRRSHRLELRAEWNPVERRGGER